MSVTVEPLLAQEFAYDTLAADATLAALLAPTPANPGGGSIHLTPVQGVPGFPSVIIQALPGPPDTTAMQDNAPLIWASPIVQVTVTGDDGMPSSDLGPIAGRVNYLLHGQASVVVPGQGEIISMTRTSEYITEDVASNKVYPKIVQQFATDAKAA